MIVDVIFYTQCQDSVRHTSLISMRDGRAPFEILPQCPAVKRDVTTKTESNHSRNAHGSGFSVYGAVTPSLYVQHSRFLSLPDPRLLVF
jgi:hypothetical protein